jgi:glyoxylase-like metal-dependent hydrolase (beta-lactamase superfamily II)
VLIDSPRYVAKLVEAFERMGGLIDVLLSHQDDVADADKYADKFSARVWIHDDDRSAATYATNVLKGTEMTDIGGNLIAIPVPGHTRGSAANSSRPSETVSISTSPNQQPSGLQSAPVMKLSSPAL